MWANLPLAASLLAFVEDVRTFVGGQTPEMLGMLTGVKQLLQHFAVEATPAE